MKKIIYLIVSCFILQVTVQAQPKRVILFGIDGLHWEAPQRLKMPAFNSLIEQGTYIRESYVIIPHHPTVGDYSKFNSCSFPNPVLHQGTIFLSPDNTMIQEIFSPQQQTAFVVNTTAYKSVGRGFSTLVMDDTFSDADVVDCAINILKTQAPVFMRIHLQRAGQRGYDISQSTPDKPYYRNIFADNSPYVEAIENADMQLGRFVSFLKESGMWDETVFIVTSDHGQSRIGWHPLFDEDSWKTPLVFVGNSIAQGRELGYFEHTDLAPTIAGLLGKEWPLPAEQAGIFVREILQGTDITRYVPHTYIKTLNQQIKEYNLLKAKFVLLSETDGYFANFVALLENQTFIEPFYHQDRILNWKEAGTISHLIEANEKVLNIMRNKVRE
ncbi:sulfatase-like hydrolase/transferase [Proteiniphilum sp.]|uniref:sulfatase-like hydrolase/transferase n=1 Tax=Proteiniphilum sp. TaxID=1926877 RepID=UPI002B20BAE3|nr:sulfatase-like hydrolase/transferase [Proteiniphilum sp.]MEA4917084.1 sulfatase-like hydrolase/transferase [Proteiniphilum sp.]